MIKIRIPRRLEDKLREDQQWEGIVKTVADSYSDFLTDHNIYFFPEYTNHGIKHIEEVLEEANKLATENTISNVLSSQDIAVLILATIIHDAGMHLNISLFHDMILSKDILLPDLDKDCWHERWTNFLDEAKKFSGKQKKSLFGYEDIQFKIPNLANPLTIDSYDRLLIGEFIRRNHPRLAHEFAISGITLKNEKLLVLPDRISHKIKDIIGLIGRSHGMEIRNTFDYLTKVYDRSRFKPLGIHAIYLMVLLRLADYFQIDSARSNHLMFKLDSFISPISKQEHEKHLSIDHVGPLADDPETFWVDATPLSSLIYIKLNELFFNIQYEIDVSWAILGEVYGKDDIIHKPTIRYRRIRSNIDKYGNFGQRSNFLTDKITFTIDPDLSKLLIAPLYGDNPSYGVRELIQNSVDACKERQAHEVNNDYESCVRIHIYEKDEAIIFKISDNGKGMSAFEIKNYFLKVGSSYRKSFNWSKKYINEDGNFTVTRNGKFGIGVLAAFLLGEKLSICTRSMYDTVGHIFDAGIDDTQIEVIKSEMMPIGTTIEIVMTEQKLKELFYGSYSDTARLPDWDSWYVNNDIDLQYRVDKFLDHIHNSKIKNRPFQVWYRPFIDIADQIEPKGKWRRFYTPDYEEISWTYDYIESETHSLSDSNIVCNGIIIPYEYEFEDEIVFSSPFMNIVDKKGKLGLNLSRNKIDGFLEFETELINEILKDIIAKLITIGPKNFKTINTSEHKAFMFRHRAFNRETKSKHGSSIDYYDIPYLYGSEGYSLFYEYFTNKLFEKKLVDIILPNSDLEMNFIDWHSSEIEEYMFLCKSDIKVEEESNQGLRSFITAFNNIRNTSSIYERGSVVSIKTTLFEKIFSGKIKNTIRKEYKNSIIIISQNSEWTTFTYNFSGSFPEFIKIDKISKQAICYSLGLMNSPNTGGSQLFDKFLLKYIGDDVILPYELSSRKKIYKTAFDELHDFVIKYI